MRGANHLGRVAILSLTFAFAAGSLPSRAAAEPLEEIFVTANRAYFAGNHPEAARGYERLVAAGVADADVFYNLGVARARMGEYGEAMVAFEKALALRPGEDDAEDALAKVRDALAQQRAEREGESTTVGEGGLLAALGALLPADLLAYLVLVLNAIAFGSLAGLLRSRSEPMRIALGVTAPIAFALLVLGGLALLGRTEALEDGHAAIVVDDHVTLREGPDPNAGTAGEVREGDRVRLVAQHDAYYEIVAPNGSRGWVDRATVGRLDVFPLDQRTKSNDSRDL
jgi:tetratricopeptide (TPR) repeat protein